MSTFEAKNLRVWQGGADLISNAHIRLKRGRITGLIGKSGSGKSLSSLALSGFLPPNLHSSAEFFYDGASLAATQAGKLFANVVQNPRTAFNPVLKIKAHAKETLKAAGAKAQKENIIARLSQVGLSQKTYESYPFELSGGMLQRACIALALMQGAPFIIADEPTTDLDLISQKKILDLLGDLARRENIGLLLITHDFSVINALCDDVYAMDGGRVVWQGKPSEIYSTQNAAILEIANAHRALSKELL